MPRTKLELGARWGALTVIDVEVKEKPYSGGQEERWYVIQCGCGELMNWTAQEWLDTGGTTKVRDCGCGLGTFEERVQLICTVPLSVKVGIRDYAAKNRISLAKGLVRLVRFALEHQEIIE